MRSRHDQRAAALRLCRGCGCDDDHACMTPDGPCSWTLLDAGTPTGVCSSCAQRVDFHPLALVSIGRDEDEEIETILAFAELAPPYRAQAIEIAQALRQPRGIVRT
jgi:hypothetical protein